MRRLTVMQVLPALESGGVERSTLEIARALVESGHRSVVISAGGRLLPLLHEIGSEHVTLDVGRKTLFSLRHISTLRRLFAELRPDVVHARSRLPAWLAYWALRGMSSERPHFLTTVHGLNSAGKYSSIMTRGEQVICVSQTVRAHVLANWPRTDPGKLVVIERGIDPAAFPRGLLLDQAWLKKWRSEFPELLGEKLLLLPARGTRLKGHTSAIALLAALRARGVDVRLWLLGVKEPGREAYVAELERFARSQGVAEFLALSPPRSDIAQAYAKSDLVLQLSERPEAFGRTVLEALSIGRPVLGWRQGGVEELLSRHFPAGAVAFNDFVALETAAMRILHHNLPLPSELPETLALMQSQTLNVYESALL